MKKKKYIISLDKAIKSEKIIRKFLLKNSNRVRLTISLEYLVGGKNIKWHKFNQFDNPKFIALLDSLKKEFIRKTLKAQKVLGFKTHYGYYFFKLSPKLKSLINKDKLASSGINFKPHNLVGFENPIFYKGKIIIGEVISHEPIITLYLSKKEKDLLEKQRVLFD